MSDITTLKISQCQFPSFEKIVEVGKLNAGYCSYLEQNEECKNFILAPTFFQGEQEIILYWEGKNQLIPGGTGIYSYFNSKGFEVIKNPHSSILINSMEILTEEKLKELGIPSYVDIVLPVPENSLISYERGRLSVPVIRRNNGSRELILVVSHGAWYHFHAFFLQKKKKIRNNPLDLGGIFFIYPRYEVSGVLSFGNLTSQLLMNIYMNKFYQLN